MFKIKSKCIHLRTKDLLMKYERYTDSAANTQNET